MAEADYTIKVERDDGELLAIDGLAIARAFFTGDRSSVGPKSYDAQAGKGHAKRIEIVDIESMNRSMRTRSKHKWWDDVVDIDFLWLENIAVDLDILEADEEQWTASNADELAAQAFEAIFGPQRALARVGKVLHLKRPRFFPVLDKLTAEMLGLTIREDPSKAERVELAKKMMALIRREGRKNLDTLRLIKEDLDAQKIERPLVRIFDGMLWFSHPAAGVEDAPRMIEIKLRP